MKSMVLVQEIRSGHSELSVILQVSAIEGCPLSRVPLYVSNSHKLQCDFRPPRASTKIIKIISALERSTLMALHYTG